MENTVPTEKLVEQLEAELIQSVEAPAPAPAPSAPKKKLPRKKQLIEDVMKVSDKTEAELKKMKVKELEQFLASIIEKEVTANNDFQPQQPQITDEERIKFGAESLNRMNNMFAWVIEKVSLQGSEYIGTDLTGFEENVRKQEKSLMPILKQIYIENSESINQYMSAGSQYSMIMLSVGSATALENLKKNKKAKLATGSDI